MKEINGIMSKKNDLHIWQVSTEDIDFWWFLEWLWYKLFDQIDVYGF